MNRALAAALVLGLAALAGPLAAPPGILAAGPNPVVDAITPDRGTTAGGTAVTITGSNFAAPMTVTFGTAAATSVVVVSPTEITCVTPAGTAGAVTVIATQTTPPASTGVKLAAYTYVQRALAWVPRAVPADPGDGSDIQVVDYANRLEIGVIDFNPWDAAHPGATPLPPDDEWRVTQVLFDANGEYAFVATAGIPGTSDSGRLFVVRTSLVGSTVDPSISVVNAIETGGNPYQVALSSDGNTLYAVDGGSWKDAEPSIAGTLPDFTIDTGLTPGSFRAWTVTDRTAEATVGSPVPVGVLPSLTYRHQAHREWGTNSSFRGVLLSAGGRTLVASALSSEIVAVDLSLMRARDGVKDAGIPSTPAPWLSYTDHLPSPWSDDDVLVMTRGYGLSSIRTDNFAYRLSAKDLVGQFQDLDAPISFKPVPPPIPPDPEDAAAALAGFFAGDLQQPRAWPHADGRSLVGLSPGEESVLTWYPNTGTSFATPVDGGGPPLSLAFNDAFVNGTGQPNGVFYAVEAGGGWSVFNVPATPEKAPPVLVGRYETGSPLRSLRVAGDGSFVLGTGAFSLGIIDSKAGSPTVHTLLDTMALDLDPAGGPLFLQPGTGGARTFVPAPGGAADFRVVGPTGVEVDEEDLEAGTVFDVADVEDGAEFETEVPPNYFFGGAGRFELEIGNQRDFLRTPGALTLRFPIAPGQTTVAVGAKPWRRLLRAASWGGYGVRPLYARVVAVFPGGFREGGEVVKYWIGAAPVAENLLPVDGSSVAAGAPPTFSFDASLETPFSWAVEIAPAGRFGSRAAIRVEGSGDGSDTVEAEPEAAAWATLLRRACGNVNDGNADLEWRVRLADALGRRTTSGVHALEITGCD
jgi:hypothetical protein